MFGYKCCVVAFMYIMCESMYVWRYVCMAAESYKCTALCVHALCPSVCMHIYESCMYAYIYVRICIHSCTQTHVLSCAFFPARTSRARLRNCLAFMKFDGKTG